MIYIYLEKKDICACIEEEDKEYFLKENRAGENFVEFPTEKEMADYAEAYREEKRKEISKEDKDLLEKLKERI